MKRILTILIAVIVLGGAGAFGYQYFTTRAEPKSLSEDPSVEIVQVGRKTLIDTVSASGSIEPEAEVDMKFETGGKVSEVLVKEGQYVTAGTVLARLDTTDLELKVRSAEIDLVQAKANLEQLLEPEMVEKIKAAEASVESARLNLAELLDGADADEVTKAEAALKQTEITLKEAQWKYDQVAYRGDVGAMSQANELQDATLAYESALADYNIAIKDATPAEVASARSTLANAESSLAELKKAPSNAEVAAQQASVDKAQLSLEEAQRALDDAVLVAPTDGIVLVVNIEPGERVLNDADEAAMTIANTSTYLLKMEVDELDIGQVKVGQQTEVSLDAYAEKTFKGVVTNISPSASSSSSDSIITYEVTISLDTAGLSLNLLSGMTANANIQTRELSNVVVVPNRAIQVDEANGESVTYVNKLDEQGNLTRVEIATGLRSGAVTQVVAGLDEGDEVIIQQETKTTS